MMTPAARSLFVFGLYLVGAGCLLMLVPALLLGPLGLPAPADAWGRLDLAGLAFDGHEPGITALMIDRRQASAFDPGCQQRPHRPAAHRRC